MKNKLGLLLSLGAMLILVGAGCSSNSGPVVEEESKNTTETQPAVETKTETETAPVVDIKTDVKVEVGSVKEFSMTAYYDQALKKALFSLPEMKVKKGDKVKVKITNTMGMHDFVIDELKVAKELPLNEEVVVEFTADKAGEFVYYCSKPGHKASGQWGTLKVTE